MSTTFSVVVYVKPPHARPNRPSTMRITPSVLFTASSFGDAKLGTEQSDNRQMARYSPACGMPTAWFCPRSYRRLVQLSLQSCALPSCLLSSWPYPCSLLPLLL